MITAQVIINKSINVPIPARRVPSRPRLYLASHKNENGEVTIFDADGRELTRQQGALTTQTEYDPQGRLHKHYAQHTNTKERPIHREYGYDPAGNLNLLKEGIDETKYVYDALHRLKLAASNAPEFFDFDPAGNLLSISSSPSSAPGKVQGNRLLVQGDKHFDYDARGNLIKESKGKDGKLQTHYRYNLNNQLIEVISNQHASQAQYKYDPLGRRIEKTDTFGTTRFLWADNLLIQESRKNSKKTYIHEPGSFKPLAQVQDDQIYHYHLDHLGTPRELTNDAGKIVWKARYRTYGSLALKEIDEVENNLRFQGQYFDEETGLHYNRFRYYSPDTGQFINQDPIGLLGGLNNYQYAPNPISWIDPLGLCKEELQIHKNAEAKGFSGIKITQNGGPTFADTDYLYPVTGIQKNVVNIPLTGSRRVDFATANAAAGLCNLVPKGRDAPTDYVWHHVDDFNSAKGTATLELVTIGAHSATIPHKGSVKQYEDFTGKKYKR